MRFKIHGVVPFKGIVLISLLLSLLAREGDAQQRVVKPAFDKNQESKIPVAIGVDGGKKDTPVQSALAVENPRLVKKMGSKLFSAWEKASTDGAEVAVSILKAKNVKLAESGQDVVVVVSLEPGAELQEVETFLRNRGVKILRAGPDTIKIAVPIADLGDIALIPGVLNMREIKPPRQKNTNKTQGVSATWANTWHAEGSIGQNVKVAIVDTDFANHETLKAQDEIPASTIEVNYTGESMDSGDDGHGGACAEIVYDMAPGVQMYLIKIDDLSDFIAAKDYCIANGIKVISCSLGGDALNFHDGMAYANEYCTVSNHPVTAVNLAQDGGILWVMAAGNEQRQHTLIDWRDAGTDGALDWNSSGDDLNVLWLNGSTWIPAGTWVDIYMTWNQWPTTDQDFDLELYRNTGSGWTRISSANMAISGNRAQNGSSDSDPVEECYYETTVEAQYAVAVKGYGTTTSPKFILRYYGVDEPQYFGYGNTKTPVPGSISIPGDAASAFTVGAVDYQTYTKGPIEEFSSLGPNNRAYTGGSAVLKPDICGPDGITSSAYGDTFYGTSAATPHIAGLAALVRGKNPSYTVAQVRSFIESNRFDLGTAGKDNTYGSGAARMPIPTYTLTVVGGSGSSSSCTNGQRVTIKATVPKGMKFTGWNDGNTNVSRIVTMPPVPVTYTASLIDIQKPTVVISYPTKSLRVVTNGTVVLRGTAADNGTLGGVVYQLRTGEWTNAVTTNVWKNWTANFYPVNGLNTARVFSVDVQ